jgi:hypothetical protein
LREQFLALEGSDFSQWSRIRDSFPVFNQEKLVNNSQSTKAGSRSTSRRRVAYALLYFPPSDKDPMVGPGKE